MFGIPVNLPKKSYKVIEDLAQSIGAKVNGKKLGLEEKLEFVHFMQLK